LTGSKIVEVVADLGTIVKTRYTSGSTQAFSSQNGGGPRPVSSREKTIAIGMLRFANGV
jgi:hypothetical protein